MICPTTTPQSPTIHIECTKISSLSMPSSLRPVPEDHTYNVKQVNFLIDVGVYHFDRECYELAETSFRLALTRIGISNVQQQHEEDGPSCQELCDQQQLDDDDEDMQVYRGALQLCPSDDIKSVPAILCYNIGQTYIARGQYNIARKWFECALARSYNTGCIGLEVWILHNIGYCVNNSRRFPGMDVVVDAMTRMSVLSNKPVHQ